LTSIGVRVDFGDYPGLLPGTAMSFVVALLLSERVARRLGSRRAIAWLLIAALGIVLSATLTPGRTSFSQRQVSISEGCDLHRIGPAPFFEYRELGLTASNVFLFVPLGIAIGALPRRRAKALILLGAIVLPFGIEAIQLAAIPLGRRCQSGDVFDNLTGLVVGFAIGLTYEVLSRRLPARE